jgi:phage-related baseplate assembly protein
MRVFAAVDLSKLPRPSVLAPFTYEAILADLYAELAARAPDLAASVLPSDPVAKVLDILAYREFLKRQEMREGSLAVMLAYATGVDLDQVAANMHVSRQLIEPGNPATTPPRPAVWESDERLRERAQLAFEGLSVAGPIGAYVFHAKSADPRVADVSVMSPSPGLVRVHILASDGDGTAPPDLLARVAAVLNDDDVRPLTDRVEVRGGTRNDYVVRAALELYQGPDATVVIQAALDAVRLFTIGQRRLGEPVTLDGLYKALRADGVRKVNLLSPGASIEPGPDAYGHCTSIQVEGV